MKCWCDKCPQLIKPDWGHHDDAAKNCYFDLKIKRAKNTVDVESAAACCTRFLRGFQIADRFGKFGDYRIVELPTDYSSDDYRKGTFLYAATKLA